MAYKPQLVLLWQDDMMVQTVQREIEKTHLPTFMIPFREVSDMPRAFRLAGAAIGESKQANILANYSQKIIDEVHTSVSKAKPTRYYYAEGTDGLSTECDTSFHVEALNFAGGENVHKCQQSGLLGLEKINFEKLITYNPDVIIVQNRAVYNDLIDDPLWKNPAVSISYRSSRLTGSTDRHRLCGLSGSNGWHIFSIPKSSKPT
jgi:iron complex transport system substrate-binding protein